MVGACHTLEYGHLGVSQRKILILIVKIAVGLQRLQLDCGDCSWIAEIAVGLLRLQSDCGDCSWIVEIAVELLRLQYETVW